MQIRRAKLEDLPQMLLIYQRARRFMKETGNPNQWKDSYPEDRKSTRLNSSHMA